MICNFQDVLVDEIKYEESIIDLNEALYTSMQNIKQFFSVVVLRKIETEVGVESASKSEESKKYEIIDGFKRVAAAIHAGLREIPAYILEKEDGDQSGETILQGSLIKLSTSYLKTENLLADVDAVANLIRCGMSDKDIAAQIGVTKVKISKLQKAYTVPIELKEGIKQGAIPQKLLFYISNLSAEGQDEALILFAKQKKLSYEDLKRIKNGEFQSEEQKQRDAAEGQEDPDKAQKDKIIVELKRALRKGIAKGFSTKELNNIVKEVTIEMQDEEVMNSTIDTENAPVVGSN